MMKQLITYLKENLAADELILGTDDVSNNVVFYENAASQLLIKFPIIFLIIVIILFLKEKFS